jgi:uncharacterized protein YjiS (DUF1127 family)
MTTLARPVIRLPVIGATAFFARVTRLIASRQKGRSLKPLTELDDPILRDIGMGEDIRYVLRARRAADLARLRMRSQGGPFFIPPA